MKETKVIAPSGSIFYKDDYDVIYNIDWQTIGEVIDLTIITQQPFVWGQEPKGYVKNGMLFRYGVVTVQRQVIRSSDYSIVADGTSQYTDYVQMNFPCSVGPVDNFKYHLNSDIIDEEIFRITSGLHWADLDNSDDSDCVWGDINDDGSMLDITSSAGFDILGWVDVWSN